MADLDYLKIRVGRRPPPFTSHITYASVPHQNSSHVIQHDNDETFHLQPWVTYVAVATGKFPNFPYCMEKNRERSVLHYLKHLLIFFYLSLFYELASHLAFARNQDTTLNKIFGIQFHLHKK